MDIAGDLDFAGRLLPSLAFQGSERADFTTADTKTFKRAWFHSGGQTDFAVLECVAFVREQQRDGAYHSGWFAALAIADRFKFVTLGVQSLLVNIAFSRFAEPALMVAALALVLV